MKAGIIAKVLGGIGLLTVLVLVVTALMNWNNIRIHYHVILLQDARRPVQSQNETKQRYSWHWVRWLAEGKPEAITQRAAAWKHEDALIKLGYCERRVYTMTSSTMLDFVKALTGHQFKDGLLTFTAVSNDKQLVLFAAKEDFPFLEAKIKEVEKEKK